MKKLSGRINVGDKVKRIFGEGYIGSRTTYTVEEIRDNGIAELSYFTIYLEPMTTVGTISNLERVIPEHEVKIEIG